MEIFPIGIFNINNGTKLLKGITMSNLTELEIEEVYSIINAVSSNDRSVTAATARANFFSSTQNPNKFELWFTLAPTADLSASEVKNIIACIKKHKSQSMKILITEIIRNRKELDTETTKDLCELLDTEGPENKISVIRHILMNVNVKDLDFKLDLFTLFVTSPISPNHTVMAVMFVENRIGYQKYQDLIEIFVPELIRLIDLGGEISDRISSVIVEDATEFHKYTEEHNLSCVKLFELTKKIWYASAECKSIFFYD